MTELVGASHLELDIHVLHPTLVARVHICHDIAIVSPYLWRSDRHRCLRFLFLQFRFLVTFFESLRCGTLVIECSLIVLMSRMLRPASIVIWLSLVEGGCG